MSGIQVEIHGLAEALQTMEGMQAKLKDLRPIARDLFLVVQADVDRRFAGSPSTEVGGTVLGGEDWAPLQERYLKYNPRRRGGQILRDTGELLNSLSIGSPGNVNEVREDELIFGTNLPKAGRLQEDRPFLFMHPGLVSQIENVVIHYLEV
ncbi:MAG: hypothetical protein HC857_00575 [Synechococcales cyanobacterium RU_4_20]|nr:hypothetical protein [Synechococcales cyanobacterium RU_4_20]